MYVYKCLCVIISRLGERILIRFSAYYVSDLGKDLRYITWLQNMKAAKNLRRLKKKLSPLPRTTHRSLQLDVVRTFCSTYVMWTSCDIASLHFSQREGNVRKCITLCFTATRCNCWWECLHWAATYFNWE